MNPPTRVGRYVLHQGGWVERLSIWRWLWFELRACRCRKGAPWPYCPRHGWLKP